METVMKINGYVNGIVWGPLMLTLLVGTGVYLTVILGFPQIRYFGFMFKQVFSKKKHLEAEGTVSSFAALASACEATSRLRRDPAAFLNGKTFLGNVGFRCAKSL